MPKEEYDWLDDAFDDNKQDPLARKGKGAKPASSDAGSAPKDYDWIDDAFDDSKEDPLAQKGMTGCSRLAVLICAIIVVGIALFFGYFFLVASSGMLASANV